MASNAEILKKGLQTGARMIEQQLIKSLYRAADALIDHALRNREYMGFTGNTQTSYCCGIYLYGKLVGVVSAQDKQKKPVRLKVEKGHIVYLGDPYEGRPRSVNGEVDVDSQYGEDTSIEFLRSHHPNRNGVALVMTTGTEYSEYLERYLNVLTGTYISAGSILDVNWIPIP